MEITDVIKLYADEHNLFFRELTKAWIDAGTFESLYDAATFVRDSKKGV